MSERAILLGTARPGISPQETAYSMAELAQLARTAGAQVVGTVVQTRTRPDSAFYLGRGKIEEVLAYRLAEGADLAICDDELTPVQQRNLSTALGIRVLDRTQLILDVFACRARSREGKLQVELAQLNYLLPRLTGWGTVLSRLGGGIGTRGPGETKLETDRRRIRRRIAELRRDIDELRRHRRVQRQGRRRTSWPIVALVGYTNAGKSTLLNLLTGAGVLAEDKLFATLDPTVRRLRLPDGRYTFLVDTVGFIRKLPHELVASFRATLEEVTEADRLLHLVDAAHPARRQQEKTVEEVLAELGIDPARILRVYNKIDLLSPEERAELESEDPKALSISARTGWGVERLLEALSRQLNSGFRRLTLSIPYEQARLIEVLHEQGRVLSERWKEDAIYVTAEVDDRTAGAVAPFIVRRRKSSSAARR